MRSGSRRSYGADRPGRAKSARVSETHIRELLRLACGSREPGNALAAASRALALSNGTALHQKAARVFAALIAPATPPGWHPRLEADLLTCLNQVEQQPLARVMAEVLLLRPGMPGGALWTAFLTRCINVHPVMETRLIAMRGGADVPLNQALAAQAFAGSYIWPDVPPVYSDPLRAAAYRLPQEAERAALPDMLAKLTLDEPAEEQTLAAELPSLGEDQSSAELRAQYEAAPYPRWRVPPRPQKVDLAKRFGDGQRARVLVAGCGTGFEAIALARTDPTADITAVDLSRASLGYAARMARQLDARVRFFHGDLLHVRRLAERFDLITSTGVLHHMARPLDGLRALAGATRPGGSLRIALYSARARGPVAAAHDLIRQEGLTAASHGVRAFRAHVLAAPPGDPLRGLWASEDFYSMAGCRDLCFHTREHWYSLPEAGALVAAAGLELVGIDAPQYARAAFGRGDPLDLEHWDRVELANPHLFAGMYQLWCRRPD